VPYGGNRNHEDHEEEDVNDVEGIAHKGFEDSEVSEAIQSDAMETYDDSRNVDVEEMNGLQQLVHLLGGVVKLVFDIALDSLVVDLRQVVFQKLDDDASCDDSLLHGDENEQDGSSVNDGAVKIDYLLHDHGIVPH